MRVLEDNERIERGYYSQLEKSRDMLAEYMMNEPLVEAIKLSNSGQKDDFKTHNKVIDSLMKEKDELSEKYLRLLEENEQLKQENKRAKVLLKATLDLLQKQKNNHYVLNLLENTAFYDNAECDGYCLFDDIENLLNDGGF